MTPGSSAILCFGGSESGQLKLPDYCSSRECRKARDEAAMKWAIEKGVIDP